MTDESVSDRILTIPNLITFIRLLGVGVFWWALLVEENTALAAWLVFVIGWTDWIDGYLARRLDQVSRLGTVLDPIADRLLIASAVVGGLIVGVVPVWIGLPLIAREVLMGVVTLIVISRGAGTLEVRYLGKLATFFLYGAIPAFYLGEAGFLSGLMFALGWFFGVLGLVLYWIVAIQYVNDARQAIAELKSPANPEES